MNIYQAVLMEHYQHPRNYGNLENPDFSSGEHNPSCGDLIAIQGLFDHNELKTVRFTAQGCVMSIATASLLSEYVQHKSIENILAIDAQTIQKIIGINLGPLRLKCALLPLFALQAGIKQYQHNQAKG